MDNNTKINTLVEEACKRKDFQQSEEYDSRTAFQ